MHPIPVEVKEEGSVFIVSSMTREKNAVISLACFEYLFRTVPVNSMEFCLLGM